MKESWEKKIFIKRLLMKDLNDRTMNKNEKGGVSKKKGIFEV